MLVLLSFLVVSVLERLIIQPLTTTTAFYELGNVTNESIIPWAFCLSIFIFIIVMPQTIHTCTYREKVYSKRFEKKL